MPREVNKEWEEDNYSAYLSQTNLRFDQEDQRELSNCIWLKISGREIRVQKKKLLDGF